MAFRLVKMTALNWAMSIFCFLKSLAGMASSLMKGWKSIST